MRHLTESEDEYKYYRDMDDVVKKDMSVIYRHFTKPADTGILQTGKRGEKFEGRLKNPDKIRKILKIAEEIKNES